MAQEAWRADGSISRISRMGANQSTHDPGGEGEGGRKRQTVVMKTCYYELLGIGRQATEEE